MRTFLRLAMWISSVGVLLGAPRATALEGLYLGGELGNVALTGSAASNYMNALGFGIDVGLQPTSIVDVMFSFQASSHGGNGGMNLYAPFIAADLHVGRAYDFDFTLSAGPGLYFFKFANSSENDFGVHFGGAVDVVLDEALKVGLGAKYHTIFGTGSGSSYWTLMARVGYIFGS